MWESKSIIWVARLMCIKGVAVKKTGDKVTINLGDGENGIYFLRCQMILHVLVILTFQLRYQGTAF